MTSLEKQKAKHTGRHFCKAYTRGSKPENFNLSKGVKKRKGVKIKAPQRKYTWPKSIHETAQHWKLWPQTLRGQQRVAQLSPTSAGRERTQPILESNVACLVKLKMYRSNSCTLMHEEKFKNIWSNIVYKSKNLETTYMFIDSRMEKLDPSIPHSTVRQLHLELWVIQRFTSNTEF